jgi:hypothetical protein
MCWRSAHNIAEGWQITPADLAALSPYVTAPIQRFGVACDEDRYRILSIT